MAFLQSVGTRGPRASYYWKTVESHPLVSAAAAAEGMVKFLRRPIVDFAGRGGGGETLFKQRDDIARLFGGPNQRKAEGSEGPSLIFRNGHVKLLHSYGVWQEINAFN